MDKIQQLLSSSFNKQTVIYSRNQQIILDFLEKVISRVSMQNQVFIVDPKRIWKLTETDNVKMIRPTSIENQLQSILQISEFISPRTALIVVLDYFYFLRDFRGRRVIDGAINIRLISFMNALLHQIEEKNIQILIVGYPNPFNKENVLGEQYFKYYEFSIAKLEISDNEITLKSDTNEIHVNM